VTATPIDQSTPSHELVWAAPRTFFGAPSVRDLGALDAQVAFLGVPYDAGTPQPGNRTGQAAGPSAARLRSWEQFDYGSPEGGALGWYDVEADRDQLVGVTMADLGDVAIQGSEVERNFERITEAVRRLVGRGCLLVAVGGDHSISFPLVRGFEAIGEIDVVHIDAHADFLDELGGSRLTGASQLRRLSELPFVRSVSLLGLRNVERDEVDGLRDYGAQRATSLELERAPAEAVRRVVPQSDALYVSIDLDVLDASVVPGTTLPEPGGPSYRQLREALVEIARRGRVVGFDIAELNPPHDPGAGTARVATWVITHFLSAIFEARSQPSSSESSASNSASGSMPIDA
jgi:agmatinase